MKKIILSIALTFSIFFTSSAYAVDSKLKILGTMAGYGVVGGALLGTASLAFGTSSRAIAKGASLGLYGGLLFGSYVILSYEMKKRGYGESKEDYYPDSKSPYEDSQSKNILNNFENYNLAALETKKDPYSDPLVYFNLLDIQF